MLMSNEQGSKRAAQVDFTRSGWQQFAKLNRKLGARFIRGFILRHELAAYLTAHEAAGTPLDEGCQEVRYEDGVYLLLKKMQGVWYITDVFVTEATVAYEPMFFGTGVISDSRIEAAVKADFDLTPTGIIRELRLNRSIYSKLACYGHFGRAELELP